MSPSPVSSTPILRTTLVWGAAVSALLAVAGAVVGFLIGGQPALWGVLLGMLLAFVFLGITGLSILIANRWFGDDLYVPIFFGIVLGGWIVKFVVFIVLLMLIRGQEWVDPTAFYIALVVGVVASLIVDVVVMVRMRVPHVSDVSLPTTNPEDDRDDSDTPEEPQADSGAPRV